MNISLSKSLESLKAAIESDPRVTRLNELEKKLYLIKLCGCRVRKKIIKAYRNALNGLSLAYTRTLSSKVEIY